MSEVFPGRASPARGEVVHASARARVTRVVVSGRAVVCKQPLGVEAPRRLRHEVAVLERLREVAGVAQLVEAPQYPGCIVLEDAGHGSLVDVAKPIAGEELIELALMLARAVAGMHARGVLHRDIAPANVVLSGDSVACLVGFGSAMSLAEIRPEFTPHSEIVGSLAYLAPEQTGRTGRLVDQRADLYALGATLYELATGKPPFGSGDPLALIHDHLARVPVPPGEVNPALPAALSAIVVHLLEKEPDDRYQSAEGVVSDLERLRDADNRAAVRIGQQDVPLQLLAPVRLVGREDEVAALREAFAGALEGRCRGVLVAGAPGVGKTALVDQLRSVVTGRDGRFVAGKFDQYRRDLEFDAVHQAGRALGRLLLAEPEDELAAVRARILAAVGPNAGLLTATLPEFAALLAVAPDPGDPLTAQARIARAMVDLLQAVASRQRPVVVFLDDLQWAGRTPLALVDLMLGEEPVEGLLLVGAYRDGDVERAHLVAAPLARWREQPGVRHLRLDNLRETRLGTMVSEMLRVDSVTAAGLAKVISAQTSGNPYETVELLNALRRDGMLCATAAGWRWDDTAVGAHLGRSEVAGLLAPRLDVIQPASRQLVEAMACLGGRVELSLLQTATAEPADAVEHALGPALDDGLLVLEPGVHEAVRFRHDRIREAILRGLDPQRRRALQLAMARRLGGVPELFSVAAEQYLPVIDAVEDASERRRVVGLLRRAADQAALVGDHALVNALLTGALALIDTGERSMLVEVRSARHAARVSWGRLDEADEEYRTIEQLGPTAVERADATAAQVFGLTHRKRFVEAVALGVESLSELGVNVPTADRLPAELDLRFNHVYGLLDRTDGGGDLAAPDITDPTLLAASRLINATQPAAYYAADLDTYSWLSLEALRIWLEHGPGPTLVGPASVAAVAAIALRGDYGAAYRVVRRLLAVGEARGYEPGTSHARFMFARYGCWFEPIENGLAAMQQAREGLLAGGELAHAGYSYSPAVYYLLDRAASLDSVVAEIEAGLAFLRRTGNEQTAQRLDPYRWLAGELLGENVAAGDEVVPADRYADSPLALLNAHVARAIAAAVFGDPAALARHSAAAMTLLPTVRGAYVTATARLLRGLALAGQARAGEGEERDAVVAELDAVTGWLAARALDAPENFSHLVRWLEAERAWAVGDFRTAVAAFDGARREVAGRERPWHRALIAERAARFYLAHGVDQAGFELLAQARGEYLAWGAAAKVAQLDWAYPTVQPTDEPTAERGDDQTATVSHQRAAVTTGTIDLLGVLAASQALSSETSLERLQARVVEVLGAMTGATAVQLLVWSEDDQDWLLPVPGGGTVPVGGAGDDTAVPLSVLRYVRRTGEPLVVGDATGDDRFARDPYFAGVACCSVLVLPILSRGELRALLVLENRLIRGAFSAERLEVVKLIAGQLAVSLDNAHVYAEFRRVGDEQAALRRMATLVAHGEPPDRVFAAVAAEVGQLIPEADVTWVGRYDDAGEVEFVGGWSEDGTPGFVGERVALGGENVATLVFERNAPARVDLLAEGEGSAAVLARSWARSAAGTPISVEGRLWGAMAVASERPAGLPVGVELRLADFTELVATAIAKADGQAQLVAARRRVIEATDRARARLARDIHDGAQQQFVTALIDLQLAQQKRSADPRRARELMDLAAAQVDTGVGTLRDLAAGVHPAILSDIGLKAALKALAARMPLPLAVDVDDLELPAALKASVYFFCSEALTNIVKHAAASTASVTIQASDGQIRIEVHDDGVGGAEIGSGGTGLIGLHDRIGAVEGSLTVTSPQDGTGTTLVAHIPLPS